MEVYQQRTYWPTVDWKDAVPQEVDIDPAHLSQLHSSINEHVPGLHGLLIIRYGYLAFEQYYQGFHRRSYNSISSATKSVISILIGVAFQQGLLKSLDQPMLDFFPEYAAREQDPRKHAVTLRHLLSLQTGFIKEVPHEYWRDPIRLSLERPMERLPGEEFHYHSQAIDLLSAILTRVTGKKAAAFADETVFKSLGIWREKDARFAWKNDPGGAHVWHKDGFWDEKDGFPWKVDLQAAHNTGGFGAHFTAREMAKLGYLYLNKGYWDGEQLISEEYVRTSTCKQSEGGWPLYFPYGYLWWLPHINGYEAFLASGFGSKLIYVVPALDLVIVTIASTEKALKDPTQNETILNLIPNFILPAIIKRE